jgi:serine phosphatase RsbU (regulator of sigma subunit)
MIKLLDSISEISKPLLFIIAVITVIILGFIDYATGEEFSFFLFYVIPVLFIVWFGGKWQGLIISLLCLISWYIDSFVGRPEIPNYLAFYWNMVLQLGFFLILIFILSSLKQAIEKQKLLEKEKIRREYEIAAQVQEKLFPQDSPAIEGLDYFGVCKPAEAVGGDYFDYFKIKKEEIAFAIGDIAGHGLSSALLMAGLVGYVRSSATIYSDKLDEFMEKINRLMCNSTDGSKFATFFYSIYNENEKSLKFVNAGHNPPLLYRKSTNTFTELKTNGFIIGAMPDFKYKEDIISLREKDVLVFYTDGITEAFNLKDELYGTERMKNIVCDNLNLDAKGICNKILSSVKTYSEGKEQADDMTLLIIKINK